MQELLPEDQILKNINFNMQFLGLDLGKIPQQNLKDWTVYIIPLLYILSTYISMKLTNTMQKKDDEKYENKDVIDITDKKDNQNMPDEKIDKKEQEKDDMEATMKQYNSMMAWMMPILAVSVSLAAPLGLALYWLVNNILMIVERLVLDKIIKD